MEIVNKVAKSVLMVFDLEDYYPKGNKINVDISQWLIGGFLLKEQDFRTSLQNHDWRQYEDALVAVYCSTDAILPAWAMLLVTTQLQPFAKKIVLGNVSNIDAIIYTETLAQLDYSIYQDKPVILKGCSKKPVPEIAYILAMQKLQTVAKSVMYGEACSAVPLFKRKK
jgi:hypothetical protein